MTTHLYRVDGRGEGGRGGGGERGEGDGGRGERMVQMDYDGGGRVQKISTFLNLVSSTKPFNLLSSKVT